MSLDVLAPLLRRFKEQVCQSAAVSTVCADVDWTDMATGWFLAQGCTPVDAMALATTVAYEHGFWADEESEQGEQA